MSRIQLFLTNFSDNYYPGNTINGKLECYFNSEKTVRGIKIGCTGKESTRWSDSETYYDHHDKKHKTRQVTYTGENKFFHNEINLLGRSENILPAGQHTYTFSFTLPYALPNTFEGTYGKITYKVKAVVDRPWKTDYEAQVYFNLISPIDLNNIGGDLLQPVSISDDKSICCCCCKSGPLTFAVTVPKTGYAPGETINFTSHVKNLSNVNVSAIKFKFVRNIKSVVTSPSTKYKNVMDYLGETRERGVGAHGDYVFQMNLLIPENVKPLNFTNSKLFEVHYSLHAEAVLPSPHTNLSFSIPLQFGHVPLGRRNSFIPAETSTLVELPSALPPSYPNNPPYPPNPPYPSPSMPLPYPSNPLPYTPGPTLPYPTSSQGAPSAPTANSDPWTNEIKAAHNAGGAPSAPIAPPPSYEEIMGGNSVANVNYLPK